MSCDETTALLTDRLHGAISAGDERRLEAHLADCAACRAAASQFEALWDGLGLLEVDVPHERLRARFHAALAAHEVGASRPWLERFFASVWPQRPALQAAFAVALAVIGVLIGQRLPSSTDREVAQLREEVRSVGLALLDHQSAAERLLAVSWSQRAQPSPEIVAALLERVEYDDSVNVRLAAIEALRGRLERPDVSAGLATALARQDAPLVQIALTDALLASRKPAAVAAVRQMLARSELDPAVREYVQTALDGDQAPGPRAQI
jgi:predicted anti-sigma-YlaC factor YlaD